MGMRTHTIVILVALLGFGSAFGVSRFGVHGGEAAAAAPPIAFDVPAELRVGKVALPAAAPALVPRRIAPPPPPRPAPVRRAPRRPAPPPPTPRQTQSAAAPQTGPSQQTATHPQTTAPAQTTPPPQAPPARPKPAPAPPKITIIGGD